MPDFTGQPKRKRDITDAPQEDHSITNTPPKDFDLWASAVRQQMLKSLQKRNSE